MITKKKDLSQEEILQEIKQLSEKARKEAGSQRDLFFQKEVGDEDIDTGYDYGKLNDTADPDRSHKIYYAMRRLMIENLPKGQSNEKLRKFIYEEKNLFLNRGQAVNKDGIRNSDGRMAYIPSFLTPAFSAVVEWVISGANPFDLYSSFRKLNIERGYHKDNEGDKNSPFDETTNKNIQGHLEEN